MSDAKNNTTDVARPDRTVDHPEPLTVGEYVAVGRVTKAHGIRGQVKVEPYYGGVGDFRKYKEMRLKEPGSGVTRIVNLIRVGGQDRQLLLELEGIGDRDSAEQCRGFEVLVAREHLAALPEGQYYRHELAGLRVVTTEGLELGEVSDLLAAGAHDILVITGAGREYLIPMVKEFVVARDEAGRTLTVSPPPGLLDING